MTITNITPRETELQKQVIELAESLRNIGWEFELYKKAAIATNQKLIDEVAELKAKLVEYEAVRVARAESDYQLACEAVGMEDHGVTTDPDNTCPKCKYQQPASLNVVCDNCGNEYTKGT